MVSEANKKLPIFISGGLLAVVIFLMIFGWRVVIPTYDDWLLFTKEGVDNMQHYQGWMAYRHSDWHFPYIGLIDGIIYPDNISIIYTDSAPLFAFIFKLLSPYLPETFQYFGIFGLLSAFLLGAFSGLFIYHFTGEPVYSVLCVPFFATASVFLFRMFYHTALAAQWIVIASLYLWLTHEENEKKPVESEVIDHSLLWMLLSFIAILTEAYFLPMVWGIMVCDLIGFGIRKKDLKLFATNAVLTVLPAGLLTIIAGFVFGLFYGDVDSGGLGLGYYTFNLNGFFNPFWLSSIIPRLDSEFFQYEGLAYLGIGMMILIINVFVLGMIRLKKNKAADLKIEPYKLIPLLIFFAGFTTAAVSPLISFGFHRIYIPIPEFLNSLWSTFRSSGRMIWPVFYLIYLVTLICLGKWIKNKKVSCLILIAALIIQTADLSGFMINLHEKFSKEQTYESSLSDPRWEEIGKEYDHIMICPDVHEIYYVYSGQELQYFAQTHDMTMNIVYTSRVISDRVNTSVRKTLGEIRWGIKEADPTTVYVFLDKKPDRTLPLHYYELNGYVIGLKDPL